MSDEQPSRKNRVCAIHCRLFRLGYSSHIGISLAYAFRSASGTAYSTNSRAPSPRVPPVAPCARPAMRDKTFACTPAGPTFDICRPSRSAKSPRGVICIGRVVGALLAYGRRLSPPSRRFPAAPIPPESPATLFPCARRPCSADCANAHPTGVRASVGRARPAALFVCAGCPLPTLSLPCGARFARPYANACPLPCGLRYAPPTPRKPAYGEYVASSWCMVFPLAAGANRAECPFCYFYICDVCASRDDRTRAYYAEKRTHVRPLLFSGGYSVTICEV